MDEDIEIGSKIVLTHARQREADRYNQSGWKGEVLDIQPVTKEDAKANGYICPGENIVTVKWDNGYISDVYPENGDRITLCDAL